MVTQRIVICPSYYLCVVVKERPEPRLQASEAQTAFRQIVGRTGPPPGGATPARGVVGVTGLEPVTLRLSSACSNQLSYTPGRAAAAISDPKPEIQSWWS